MRTVIANPRCGWLGILAALSVAAGGCTRSAPADVRPNMAAALELRNALAAGSAGDAEVEQVVLGTGWGTLRGTFTLDGAAPEPRKLNVNKDIEVCSAGGHPLLSEALVVDPSTKGIANVAVFIRNPRRVHESAEKPQSPEVIFDQKNCLFLTHVVGVQVGQTLKILNSDPVGHNTNISAISPANNFNMTIPAEQATIFKPGRAENMPVPVNCSIHPWMQAYMLVKDDGYFAVTKPDGTFEIPNLPAGEELEFQVWHESGSGAQGALPLDLPELKWTNKGRFKITLQENEVREIRVVVPVSAFKVAGA